MRRQPLARPALIESTRIPPRSTRRSTVIHPAAWCESSTNPGTWRIFHSDPPENANTSISTAPFLFLFFFRISLSVFRVNDGGIGGIGWNKPDFTGRNRSTRIPLIPPENPLVNSRSIVGHVSGSMPRRPGHRCPRCERQIRWMLAYCADCAGPTASSPAARRLTNITWLEYRQRQRATRLRAA